MNPYRCPECRGENTVPAGEGTPEGNDRIERRFICHNCPCVYIVVYVPQSRSKLDVFFEKENE